MDKTCRTLRTAQVDREVAEEVVEEAAKEAVVEDGEDHLAAIKTRTASNPTRDKAASSNSVNSSNSRQSALRPRRRHSMPTTDTEAVDDLRAATKSVGLLITRRLEES